MAAAGCGPDNADQTFTVVISLSQAPASLSALKFRVNYQGGSFIGIGTGVSCQLSSAYSTDTAAFDDDDGGTLDVDIDASTKSLEEGDEIVQCDFNAETQPTADDFAITPVCTVDSDCEDDAGDPVDPDDIDLVVTKIDLAGE